MIRSLAAEYGGPLFDPHITLLAQIPDAAEQSLVEKARELVQSAKPFQITLADADADTRDLYFQSLFIHIAPSEELTRLRAESSRIFGMTDTVPYMPHLSLLYGDYPEERRRKTIDQMRPYAGESFIADRIFLYRTDGTPQDWENIGEFRMGREVY